MISQKKVLLSLAVVTGALLSSLCQAQKILTPQTPIQMPKPTATKPVQQRQEYTISGHDFYVTAIGHGFNANAHEKGFGSKCEIKIYSTVVSLEVGRGQSFPGSKCDFNVFEGKSLQNGFVFKSYRGQENTDGHANIEMTSYPASGGTSVRFSFHGWDDPGADNWAIYTFRSFILEGPADREWQDALR
jgi:hypothetical protein